MKNKKEAVEQIYKLLLSLVDEEEQEQESVEIEPPKPAASTKKSRTSNIKKSKAKTQNKFDSMPEKNMFKEDIEIDKKLSVLEPCPRTRSFNTIEVSCRVCGKKDKINPVLVHEPTRYKCNACAKSGG